MSAKGVISLPPATRESAYMELVDAVRLVTDVVNSGLVSTELRIRLTVASLGIQSVARELMSVPPPEPEDGD
jgi:hypothetical protein